MKEIIVRTQSEMDALPDTFEEEVTITIAGDAHIVVRKARGHSSVEARGHSSVEAWEHSSVVARGHSFVVARGNSFVSAWEHSSVEAWEDSSVEAWEHSSVEAWEDSSVTARGNSSVVAWEDSSVEAWEDSSVEARGNSVVRVQSDFSTVRLSGFSVAYLLSNHAKTTAKSATAMIITPKIETGLDGWFASQGIEATGKTVILYKRVSGKYLTQENTPDETKWIIGQRLTHGAWMPAKNECGSGTFHACSRPYFCDDFRHENGDKYVAIEIATDDLYPWPNPRYPHKIAFRAGLVLYECDRFGRKMES